MINTLQVFDTSITGVQPPRKAVLRSLRAQLILEEAELKRVGDSRSYISPAYDDDIQRLTSWFFDNGFRDGHGSDLYDEILVSNAGRCAYCRYQRSSSLDHVLPRSSSPFLAISPINLVPACQDCNGGLQAREQSVNLYLDLWLEDHVWLRAVINDSDQPELLQYQVTRGPSWTEEQADALQAVAVETGLLGRYAQWSSSYITDIAASVHTALRLMPLLNVNDYVLELHEIQASRDPNSWQAAALYAWALVADEVSWCEIVGCLEHHGY